MDTLKSLFKFILMGSLVFVSFILAAMFVIATLIAIGIAFIGAKIKGSKFEFKKHWQQRKKAPEWDFRKKQDVFIDKRSTDITDVEVKKPR